MNIGSMMSYGGYVPPMNRLSFNDADSDKDGSLNLNEFTKIGNNLPGGNNSLSQNDIQNIFKTIDTDQNGSISTTEAKAAYDKITQAAQNGMVQMQEQFGQAQQPSPADMFAQADTNGDGQLSLDEFKAAAAKHGHHHHHHHVENNDSANANAKSTSDQRVEDMFKTMDADNNGSVSADEMKNFFAQKRQDAPTNTASGIDMTAVYAQAAGAYANQNGSGDMLNELLSVLKSVQA